MKGGMHFSKTYLLPILCVVSVEKNQNKIGFQDSSSRDTLTHP